MWINCNEKMPADMEAVITLYVGYWPDRSNSGVTDAYAVDGKWFNIPEGVRMVGWMPIPSTTHLPIEGQHTGQSSEKGRLLGYIETDDPMISECIFEGDYSELNLKYSDKNGNQI
jgi:hypothetical protein